MYLSKGLAGVPSCVPRLFLVAAGVRCICLPPLTPEPNPRSWWPITESAVFLGVVWVFVSGNRQPGATDNKGRCGLRPAVWRPHHSAPIKASLLCVCSIFFLVIALQTPTSTVPGVDVTGSASHSTKPLTLASQFHPGKLERAYKTFVTGVPMSKSRMLPPAQLPKMDKKTKEPVATLQPQAAPCCTGAKPSPVISVKKSLITSIGLGQAWALAG